MAKSAFEQPDSVASDAFDWKQDTQARVGPVEYSPGQEVDEVHQYDQPIGGTGKPSTGPVGTSRKSAGM